MRWIRGGWRALGLAVALAGAAGCATTARVGDPAAFPESAAFRGAPALILSNALLWATVCPPGATNAFYRGGRFDGAGWVVQVERAGHTFFGLAGPEQPPLHTSRAAGAAGEFGLHNAPGYDEARTNGGAFLKIGVGQLTRDSARRYEFWHDYAIRRPVRWTVTSDHPRQLRCHTRDRLGWRWAYDYTQTLELDPVEPVLRLVYQLRNTGRRRLETEHYNHNVIRFDDHPISPDYELSLPFAPAAARWAPELARPDTNRVVLAVPALAAMLHQPFDVGRAGAPATWRVTHRPTGLAVAGAVDRPACRFALYLEPRAFCPEPTVCLRLEPGETATWQVEYRFEAAPEAGP